MRRVRWANVLMLLAIALGLTVAGFALGLWLEDEAQLAAYRRTPDWPRMRDGRPGIGWGNFGR
jgi:hypothetical protein